MKKCVVSVRYGGPLADDIVWFEKVCEGAAETYQAVKNIIEREKLNWPDQKRAKDDYFHTVSQIFCGNLIKSENHIFKIEAIES